MPPQVVGAGLGRTGTQSLKFALERLLGGTCYHMMEVFGRPDEPFPHTNTSVEFRRNLGIDAS